jgi:hypothetical protein
MTTWRRLGPLAGIVLASAHALRAQSTQTLGDLPRAIDGQVTLGGFQPGLRSNLRALNASFEFPQTGPGALRLDAWYLAWPGANSYSAAALFVAYEAPIHVTRQFWLAGIVGFGIVPYERQALQADPSPGRLVNTSGGSDAYSVAVAAHWRHLVIEQYLMAFAHRGILLPQNGLTRPLMIGFRF